MLTNNYHFHYSVHVSLSIQVLCPGQQLSGEMGKREKIIRIIDDRLSAVFVSPMTNGKNYHDLQSHAFCFPHAPPQKKIKGIGMTKVIRNILGKMAKTVDGQKVTDVN